MTHLVGNGLPVTGRIERNWSLILGDEGGGVEVMDDEGLVDCRFSNCWRKCPLIEPTDLCRFFVMKGEVRPGQVVKNPNLIAVVNVDTVGLKHIR